MAEWWTYSKTWLNSECTANMTERWTHNKTWPNGEHTASLLCQTCTKQKTHRYRQAQRPVAPLVRQRRCLLTRQSYHQCQRAWFWSPEGRSIFTCDTDLWAGGVCGGVGRVLWVLLCAPRPPHLQQRSIHWYCAKNSGLINMIAEVQVVGQELHIK